MAPAPYEPDIRNRVIELRLEDKTADEVRKLTGVSRQTQTAWLQQEGLTKRFWPQEIVERCRELRRKGYSYNQIRRTTGVPRQTQRRWYANEPELYQAKGKKFQANWFELAKGKQFQIDGVKLITYRGLTYKKGVHGKLFYQNEFGEWRKSTLHPSEVGFI